MDSRCRTARDTTFGKQAMNNGNFVFRLEGGAVPLFRTIDRVRAFIDGKTKATAQRRKAK